MRDGRIRRHYCHFPDVLNWYEHWSSNSLTITGAGTYNWRAFIGIKIEMKKSSNLCPICRKDVTNGVGPSALPEVTNLLNSLPSSHIFREAANWHDLRYHEGKTEKDRKIADERFYQDMLEAVSANCSWYSRGFYRLQALRNYWFVRRFGNNFFNYNGCSCELARTNSDQTA